MTSLSERRLRWTQTTDFMAQTRIFLPSKSEHFFNKVANLKLIVITESFGDQIFRNHYYVMRWKHHSYYRSFVRSPMDFLTNGHCYRAYMYSSLLALTMCLKQSTCLWVETSPPPPTYNEWWRHDFPVLTRYLLHISESAGWPVPMWHRL